MPLGEVVTYDMEAGPFRKPESFEDTRGNITMTYNATNSWRNSRTDREGILTTYTYADGLHETSRTEASGTPKARTIQTDWNNTVNRAAERREPGHKTKYSYNSRGQVLTRTETDTATSATRVWTYTYFETPSPGAIIGQVNTINGPRTDVSDITTHEYYTMNDAGGAYQIGDLKAVVNALGHRSDYLQYDGNGRPLQIRDANNVTTTLTYHSRGWISGRTTAGQATQFSYDDVGNLTRVTQDDGSFIDYEYDDAHRLIAIADNFDNRVEYALDAAGNRTEEETFDDNGILRRQLARDYDQLSRLQALIDGNNDETGYAYDDNGNRVASEDANFSLTTFEYDPLNRLTRTINALSDTTLMGYDARDNLTSVTDPNGNVTQYTYDGLNNQIELDSPDTGVTEYEYDAAGNRTAATDARGITTEYEYDALNRLTDVLYPDSGLDVSFTYDAGTNGKGRLTGMSDVAGSVSYAYDARGNLLSETRTIGGTQYVTSYAYNDADRLDQIIYPSGMVIDYTLDAAGRITTVEQTIDSTTVELVGDVQYEPFGPVTAFDNGNGSAYSAAFDQDYELDQLESGTGLDWLFGYDPVGNILSIDDQVSTLNDQSFGYDDLYRLETAEGDYPDALFEYDDNGNRLRYLSGLDDEPYTYEPDTNRLATQGSWTFTVDAAGNRTEKLDGSGYGQLYGYADNSRLVQTSVRDVSGDTVVGEYLYDGRGQRVAKTVASGTTHFVYGPSGELLGEYEDDGDPISEYIWLNGQPVAVWKASADETYFIHTDHLGTPRQVSDELQTVVWRWDSTPFGDSMPNEDPDADLNTFTMNLRFPGQYYDQESGLHYNYFRDYDPAIGRYIESDPIGLDGGLNTFGYANANPLGFIDSTGQAVIADDIVIIGGILIGACIATDCVGKAAGAISKAIDEIAEQCSNDEDECERLIRQIRSHIRLMQTKMDDLQRDKFDLFEEAYDDATPGLPGTWLGHVERYQGLRVGLKRLVRKALMKGCEVPPEAFEWILKDPPLTPGG